jgi:hypothetical protein
VRLSVLCREEEALSIPLTHTYTALLLLLLLLALLLLLLLLLPGAAVGAAS